MLKQLLDSKECGTCKDPCCRFNPRCESFFPLFTKDEMEKVIKQGYPEKIFKKISDNVFQIIPTEKEGRFMLCPFSKDKLWCAIYKDGPMYCKLWPFYLMYSKDKKFVYLTYDNEEDCSGLSKKIHTEEFRDYVDYLLKYFTKQKVKKHKALIIDHYPCFEILGVVVDGSYL